MPDNDITKFRTFQNWQVIALLSVTISITSFATGVIYQIDQTANRVEYVNDRIDRKASQLTEEIEELKKEIENLKSK